MILLADNEGPDQTAHSRSLIWAFAVRIWYISLDGSQVIKASITYLYDNC